MSLIPQHSEMISLLKENNLSDGNDKIIYVTVKKNPWKQAFFKDYVVEGYWLCFNSYGLTFIDTTMMGKITGAGQTFKPEEIGKISLKKGLVLYTLRISDRDGEESVFRVASSVLGNKRHYEDFLKIKDEYSRKN